MAQRGDTRQVLLPPTLHTEVAESEAFAPLAIELRNGRLTDTGAWVSRPGLAEWYAPTSQLPGNSRQVLMIIPDGPGYFTLRGGRIFRLTPTPARVPGLLLGTQRPTWTHYRKFVVIADGGPVFTIEPAREYTLKKIAGAPPNAKFVVSLDTYLILAGQDALTFQWSDTNTLDVWPAENFNSLTDEGDSIKMLKVLRRELFFFLSKRIEVWLNVGGQNPFQRRARIEFGTAAGHSVVQANDRFYFLGSDGDFYVLEGTNPRVIPHGRPRQMRGILNSLPTLSDVYGYDFRREGVIRWFSPCSGNTFTYDYVRDVFSLDSIWRSGTHQLLPISGHAEVDGETYVGSYEPLGKIRKWTAAATTDLGEPIRMSRRFRVPLSPDGTLCRVNRLRFRVERGHADNLFIQNPLMLVRWALDEQWIDFFEVPLGPIGDTNPYVDILALGSGRELALDIIETDVTPFRLTACWVTAERLGR